MGNIGRNDPCPCGSGKKYKKCCLHREEQLSLTSLEPDLFEGIEEYDYSDVNSVQDLVESTQWTNILYKTIAESIAASMSDEYPPDVICFAIDCWAIYSTEAEPMIRKLNTILAPMEYFIATVLGIDGVTQKSLSKKYGVSATTISRRYQEIEDVLVDQIKNLQSPTANFSSPSPSMQPNPGSTAASMSRMEMEKTMRDRATSKKEQAQDLIYQAFDHPSPEARVHLSKKALKLDPNQTDAYVILGEEATTYEQAIEYFLQGLQAAEREFGQAFFKENTGHFWGLIETRPYMRAKARYAECLWELGKKKEAIYQYQQMLTLNPNDNQGIRYILLHSYIDQKEYKKAKQLVVQYQEYTANIAFNRVLIEFGEHGLSPIIPSLIKKAIESNSYVTAYLLGKKKLPTYQPEYIGIGDESEAIAYALEHLYLWNREPELVNLLKKLK
jgi:tetratricopeptide (TPR) repeat protein